MKKKFKMLFEIVNKKETESWCIWLTESGKILKDISKITEKAGFDCYIKWYPKEKLDYVPTNKTIIIKTVEDIAKLNEKQFEFFIDDLRSWFNLTREINTINDIMPWSVETNKWLTWLDTWLNEAKINIKTSNKI